MAVFAAVGPQLRSLLFTTKTRLEGKTCSVADDAFGVVLASYEELAAIAVYAGLRLAVFDQGIVSLAVLRIVPYLTSGAMALSASAGTHKSRSWLF